MAVTTLCNSGHSLSEVRQYSWPAIDAFIDNLLLLKGVEPDEQTRGPGKFHRKRRREELPGGLYREPMTDGEYYVGMGVTDPSKLGLE